MENVIQLIAAIDELIEQQIFVIQVHLAPLESSWRGLYYLLEPVKVLGAQDIKISVLDLSWDLFCKDLMGAIDYEQSQLFHKIYAQEFDQPGGEPFNLLIGDYYLGEANRQDMSVLRSMAQIAAAAFAPFVTAIHPSFLGMKDFADMLATHDLSKHFKQRHYAQWQSLRQFIDARFLALVLPKIKLRKPYRSMDNFAGNNSNALWGNAAYAFASVITRCYAQTGWLLNLNPAGRVYETVTSYQKSYSASISLAGSRVTKIRYTGSMQEQLNACGFIPLLAQKQQKFAVFNCCTSVYDDPHQYPLNVILCASRIAHYIKVIARNKIGNFCHAKSGERLLQQWLMQYTSSGEVLSDECIAKYPLQAAKVTVAESVMQAGKYICVLDLVLHTSKPGRGLKFVTEL